MATRSSKVQPLMAGMDCRPLVRLSSCDEKECRRLVRCTRIMFASLRACLDVGIVDSAPNLHSRLSSSSQSHSVAASIMQNSRLCLSRDHLIIGNIPGVFVGDAFKFQAEMFVLGLHENYQGGISFSKTSSSSKLAGLTIATSIVMSGGYEDNTDDNGDVIIYSGQGGRDRGHKKQTSDQELQGGNLALMNSKDYDVEIRVIRGVKLSRNDNVIYFYDGLYKIEDYLYEPGQSGYKVYKFKLQRLPNQDTMGSVMYREAIQLRVGMLNLPQELVVDLSRGQESVPVRFYNHLDHSYPLGFRYLPQPEYSKTPLFDPSLGGCNCTGNCSAAPGNRCSCVSLNGGELPYNNSGVLIHGKHMVFECGPQCKCPPTCRNRVSQKGLVRRLEVFWYKGNWAVRSLDFIPAGTFVCQITGKVISLPASEQQLHRNKMATNTLSYQDPYLMFPEKLPRRWEEWGGNNIKNVLPDYKPPVDLSVHKDRAKLSNFVIDVTAGYPADDRADPGLWVWTERMLKHRTTDGESKIKTKSVKVVWKRAAEPAVKARNETLLFN